MITQIVKAHIVNRNDDIELLQASTMVFQSGEVVIARVATTQVDANGVTIPINMMKVGDGVHTFSELSWMMCPASDVYPWAKTETLQYVDLPEDLINKVQDYEQRLKTLEAKTISVSETTLVFSSTTQ